MYFIGDQTLHNKRSAVKPVAYHSQTKTRIPTSFEIHFQIYIKNNTLNCV